ncbi:hypothetical protein K438DRAFT_2137563 [Mycena galopus ATCC 62051]|nr:hypothetical protein K438DRAFT_2137563 [Mycena galopus ATCC 62051]
MAAVLGAIDPQLLGPEENSSITSPPNFPIVATPLVSTSSVSANGPRTPRGTAANALPMRNSIGAINESRAEYEQRLYGRYLRVYRDLTDLRASSGMKRKESLLKACREVNIQPAKSATIAHLCQHLVGHFIHSFPSIVTTTQSSALGTSGRCQTTPIRGQQPQAQNKLPSTLGSVLTQLPAAAPSGPGHPPTAVHRGELRGCSQLPFLPVASQNPLVRSAEQLPFAKSRPPVTPPRPLPNPSAPRISSPLAAQPTVPTSTEGDDCVQVDIPVITEAGQEAEDAALLQQYDVPGGRAAELLGYDDDDDDEEEDGEYGSDDDENGSDEETAVSDTHENYKVSVRVAAVRRAEGNRRAGGLKTQKAMETGFDQCLYYFSS